MSPISQTASASWLNDYKHSDKDAPLEMSGKPCPPATELDPRQTGWPCMSNHVMGKDRSNKYAVWNSCTRCGLRLRYVSKSGYHGATRAIGPPPDHVEIAQAELKELYTSTTVTEKVFNGKLMELRGRALVETGGRGRTTVQVRVDERLGEAMMASTACENRETTVLEAPRRSSPLRTSQSQRASPTPAPKASASTTAPVSNIKTKAEPVESTAAPSVSPLMVQEISSEEEEFKRVDSKSKDNQ